MKLWRLILCCAAPRLLPRRSAARGGSIRSDPCRAARRWTTRPWWSTARAACCGPMRRRRGAGGCRPRSSRSIRAFSTCCSPTRTSASARIPASIRWRWRARRYQFVDQRPHRVGRLDADHAGGAAAGAAHRAQLRRQAAPDGARDPARARAEQGRDPRALSQPRALWRQSRRHARGLARLFRQGAAPAVAGARRRCWWRCRNRPKLRRPDRSVAAARAARDRVLDRIALAGRIPADEVALAKLEPCRPAAGRCRRWRRMPPIRRSPRRRRARSIA